MLASLAILAVGIPVHEFFHAFTAWRLGDSTAKNAGRLTLNPLRHLDPFGSLLLLIGGFGWGKPVPVNPRALRYGRLGMAMVSAAGPLSNFLVALVIAVVTQAAVRLGVEPAPLWLAFIRALISINLVLCAFNLLPIAPLDGFGVAVGVLPWSIAGPIARLGQYGPGILMLLVFSAFVVRVDLLGPILNPLIGLLSAVIRAAVRLV